MNLTRYLDREVARDELSIHPQSWYDDRDIRLLPGVEATSLDLGGRTVTCSGGTTLPYHKLLLAAGAEPARPAIAGADRDGATVFRTIRDADYLRESCGPGVPVIVIGGGVLGLETAAAMARHGAGVTVLENHGWLMSRQLNAAGGELLAEHLARLGIALRTNAQAREILGEQRVRAVQLADGEVIDAEVVVLAAGVRPSVSLAEAAGLEVRRGIVVDDRLATSHPDVFAAGDVAEHRGVTYGLWSPAQFQGNIAGRNLAGVGAEFGGIPAATTLKVVGLAVFSVGRFQPADAADRTIEERGDGTYRLFLFRDGRLKGAILAGDARAAAAVEKAAAEGADYSALLAKHPTAGQVVESLHDQSS